MTCAKGHGRAGVERITAGRAERIPAEPSQGRVARRTLAGAKGGRVAHKSGLDRASPEAKPGQARPGRAEPSRAVRARTESADRHKRGVACPRVGVRSRFSPWQDRLLQSKPRQAMTQSGSRLHRKPKGDGQPASRGWPSPHRKPSQAAPSQTNSGQGEPSRVRPNSGRETNSGESQRGDRLISPDSNSTCPKPGRSRRGEVRAQSRVRLPGDPKGDAPLTNQGWIAGSPKPNQQGQFKLS
jgi:hypothetical protein